jgi:DNA repair exonuclease SbcCD ATPase subunit
MNERNEKPRSESGAGPREQAIRDRLAWNKECARSTPWKHTDEDVEYLLSRLDALRPEEPPPQTQHEAARTKLREWTTEDTPQIDCPLCGVTVKQVASATLSLALWQHVNWVCEKAKEVASLRAQLTQLEAELEAERHGTPVETWRRGKELADQANEKLRAQLTETQELVGKQAVKVAELNDQLTEARRERDANHAHACELSLEERDLRARLTEAQQARDQYRQAALDAKRAVGVEHDVWVQVQAKWEASEATMASLRQLLAGTAECPTLCKACIAEIDAALAGAGPTPTP